MITQPTHPSFQKSLPTSNIDFLVANRQKNPRAVVRNRASDLDLLLSTPTATPIVRQGRCETALPVGCVPVIETSSEHGDEGFSPNPINPSGIGQNMHTFQSSNPSSTLPVPLSLLDLDVGAPLSGDSPAFPLNSTALTESDRVIFNISQTPILKHYLESVSVNLGPQRFEELFVGAVPVSIPIEQVHNLVAFQNKDRALLRFYDLCERAGTPRLFPDHVINLFRKEILENELDLTSPGITQRAPFMRKMHRKFPTTSPESVKVQLESGLGKFCIRFPFPSIFQDHLLLPLYADPTNLVVNLDDPWSPYCNQPDNNFQEMRDGIYDPSHIPFRDTSYLGGLMSDDSNEHIPSIENVLEASADNPHLPYPKFHIELKVYTDKIGVTWNQRKSLEPIVASTTLLTGDCNENPKSYFIIGYLPNLAEISHGKEDGNKARTKVVGESVRDYHTCLKVILQPLVDFQKNPTPMLVRLGINIRMVIPIVRIGPIMGDGLSNDTICGRVKSYQNCPRLSPSCYCSFTEAGNVKHCCMPVRQIHFERLSCAALGCPVGSLKRERWNTYVTNEGTGPRGKYTSSRKRRMNISREILHHALGQHMVDNAFHQVMMVNKYSGVYGSVPSDLLHAVESGIGKNVSDAFLCPIPKSMGDKLDKYVCNLLGPNAPRSYGRRMFPRVDFSHGFSRLTMLTGTERVGVLLVLVIVLSMEEGQSILHRRFGIDFDKGKQAKRSVPPLLQGHLNTNQRNVPSDQEENIDSEDYLERVAASDNEGNLTLDEDMDEPEANLTAGGVSRKRKKGTLNNSGDQISNSIRVETTIHASFPVSNTFSLCDLHITFVFDQLQKYDLDFLVRTTFPDLPDTHLLHCLQIVWRRTARLKHENWDHISIPSGILDSRDCGVIPDGIQVTEWNELRERLTSSSFCPPLSNPDTPKNHPTDSNPIQTITESVYDFKDSLEVLLSSLAFFKYSSKHCPLSIPRDESSHRINWNIIKAGTCGVVDSLKQSIHRGPGTCNWNTQKVLTFLHTPEYSMQFGPAAGFYVGFGEHGLQTWGKSISKTAQKRREGVFEEQTAARMHEQIMMDTGLAAMDTSTSQVEWLSQEEYQEYNDNQEEIGDTIDSDSPVYKEEDVGASNGATFQLTVTKTRDVPTTFHVKVLRVDWQGRDHPQQVELPSSVINFFRKAIYSTSREILYIEVRTEMSLGSVMKLRAHPDYNGCGPWYDYVLTEFEAVRKDDVHHHPDTHFPTKILGFFRKVVETSEPTTNYQILSQACVYRNKTDLLLEESRLVQPWFLEKMSGEKPKLRIVEPANILRQIFVVEEHPGFPDRYLDNRLRRVLWVRDMRETWPLEFIKYARKVFSEKPEFGVLGMQVQKSKPFCSSNHYDSDSDLSR